MDRMRSSNGMFNGLTSGFINQRKAGETHFIFHTCAELLIFVPVLEFIRGIRWSKNNFTVSDGEMKIRISFAIDFHSRFLVEFRWQMGSKRRMVINPSLATFMGNM